MPLFYMNKKTTETLTEVADVTLDKPFTITVDLIHGGFFERFLQKWGIRPKKRVFELKPITLGNLIRISKLLLQIDEDILDSKKLLNSIYRSLDEHGDAIAEVVATAMINTKAGPSRKDIDLVRDEFTPTELKFVLSLVISRMNVSDFMHSIISIRGLNVLESEPKNGLKKKVSPSEQGR